MVPFLCLFQHFQVMGQIFLVRERGAINPLQHLVLFIATPVSTGDGQELERLDGRGVRHVGSAAQVHPVALAVAGDHLSFRQFVQDFQLVVFAHFPEHVQALFPGNFFPADVQLLPGNLLHFPFDLFQVFRGKRLIPVKVIVEPVFNHRSDRNLGFGIQVLDSMRHQVGTGMANHFQRFRGLVGNDLQCPVGRQRRVHVDQLIVEACRQGIPGKAGRNPGSHVNS